MGTWSFLSCRPREAVEPQCVLSSQTRVTRQMCEKETWSQLSATSARRARWGAAGHVWDAAQAVGRQQSGTLSHGAVSFPCQRRPCRG